MTPEDLEEKIKKAKEIADKLDEPYKSITFKFLLEKFFEKTLPETPESKK